MKTKTTFRNYLLILAPAALLAGAGCSSSSSNTDGGKDGKADSTTDATGLFGLTPGTWCYTVKTASMVTDGCMIGPGDPASAGGPVGADLPVTYSLSGNVGTLSVGTMGSLGQGTISNNMGTLLRDGTTSFDTMNVCTFHQSDTTQVTLTATNAFTVAVTEVQDMFAPACSASNVPTGGTCTSTWTWTMAIDGAGDAGAGCR